MTLKSFFCCFTVEQGAFLIGIGTMLTLLGEWYYFHMIRTILTFLATFAFLWMCAEDSPTARGIFFWTYTISALSFYIINFFVASEEEGGIDPAARAERQCEGLGDEYIQNLLFNTVDACKLASEQYIWYEVVAITVPCVIFTIYFSMVLFAHWRNGVDNKLLEGENSTPLL